MKPARSLGWLFALATVLSCARPSNPLLPSAQTRTFPSASGDTVSNGGDQLAALFTQKAYAVLFMLDELPSNRAILSTDERQRLDWLIENIRVRSWDGPLLDHSGVPVDAASIEDPRIPGRKMIALHRERWEKILHERSSMYILVFHEYLRLMKKNDDNYRISHRLMLPLGSSGHPEWVAYLPDLSGGRLKLTVAVAPTGKTIEAARASRIDDDGRCEVELRFPSTVTVTLTSPAEGALFSKNTSVPLTVILSDSDAAPCPKSSTPRTPRLKRSTRQVGLLRIAQAQSLEIHQRPYQLRFDIRAVGEVIAGSDGFRLTRALPGAIASDTLAPSGRVLLTSSRASERGDGTGEIVSVDHKGTPWTFTFHSTFPGPVDKALALGAVYVDKATCGMAAPTAMFPALGQYRIYFFDANMPEGSRVFLNFAWRQNPLLQILPERALDWSDPESLEMSPIDDSGGWTVTFSKAHLVQTAASPFLIAQPRKEFALDKSHLELSFKIVFPDGTEVRENGNGSADGWYRADLTKLRVTCQRPVGTVLRQTLQLLDIVSVPGTETSE